MLRTNPTLRSLAVLAILLAVCCAGTAYMRANLSKPATTNGHIPAANLGWSIPASGIRSVSFSPSGRFICTVSKDSAIALYDTSGTQKFVSIVPGANAAAVSAKGDCVLAYSTMNRANTDLAFLDARGRPLWHMSVSGAIWSAEAANTGDEACFAVGTGAGYVYMITIHGSSRHYRRWRAPGAVCSVSLSRDSENVAYGTWQRSSVSRSDLMGHKDWQLDVDPASLQNVRSLSNSDLVFVCSSPNRSDVDGKAGFADSDGALESNISLSASERTRALPSPEGFYICTGYTKSIRHSAKTTLEEHAALYDSDGNKLWDRGSLLFPARPISLILGGVVLLAGKGGILAVSPTGEAKQICKLPSTVERSFCSRDGLRAILLCADGKMRFLQVSP